MSTLNTENDSKNTRLSVYDYLDYRDFLKDWFEYLDNTKLSFSLRALCLKVDITPSTLYMAMSKKRGLAAVNLERILPYLELSPSEEKFLMILRDLGETSDVKSKINCYSRLSRFNDYKSRAKADIRVYKYIAAWYHVVIREMAQMPEFKADPKWIRKKLTYKISTKEIRHALNFLLDSGFLVKNADGTISAPDELIRCEKEVMKMALSQAHEQTLKLAADSIYSVPSELRRLVTFTAALPQDQFDKINDVLTEAVSKIQSITETVEEPDSVYQFSLLAFPVASDNGGGDENEE